MKTGKRTGRWKYAAIVLLLALLLGLGLLWNNANNTSNSTDEIYLYGEWHSDSHILDRELEIWGEYYKKGMRDLFVEYPYTDAQFLNLWMQADDDELLDQQFKDWEVDKFQGFVRFEEHDGMLGAVIHPKNYILPLLRPHFCGRFPEEDFMIYDAVHQAVLLHEEHSTRLLELAAPLELPPPSAREQQFQALWTQFYKTLEIKARHNEKGRMTHCPKRFWADMVELQGEL